MEIQMYLEQVKELIDTNDFETAGDAMPFVREAQAGLNELKEPCGIGGGEQVEEIREEDMIEETPQEEGSQEEGSQEESPEEALRKKPHKKRLQNNRQKKSIDCYFLVRTLCIEIKHHILDNIFIE